MIRKPISLFIPRIYLLVASAAIVAAVTSSLQAREFPRGALQRLEDLPPGRFKSQLDALRPEARERAREWLHGLHFTDGDLPSMHAHAEGGICFACHFSKSPATRDPTATAETGATSDGPAVAAAAVPVSPFPSSLVFHSKPGAPNVLYINFAGETVTGTNWNTDPSVNRASIPALAFSTDSDYSTFSDAEQAIIKRVWQRMAEDYAPFDINVTTERPATFTTRTAVALITRNTDANGALNPFSTAGGVAYVNVFGRTDFAQYRPAWIYHNNLGNSEANIAEAASHEIGHNLGLSHDGTTAPLEYYGGHGSSSDPISWGPLMGTGYSRNVSQWSKGEYYLANNSEDDLAVIAGKVPYRTDDHGGTPTAATPLVLAQGTTIASTTPENDPANSNPANKGVLERNTDIDVFTFLAGSGQVTINANPWISPANTRGGNLDILLELYDDTGALVSSSNPAAQTTATIQTTVAGGRYFLHVRNSGAGNPLVSPPTGYTSYGSIGQYFLSGTIPDGSALLAYSATMDADPGWTLDGQWQYGTPAYTSGGPSGGFTGTRIIAYNLSGNYTNNLSVRYATTPVIDATGRINLKLQFKRWLRIRNGDTVSIQYSMDGSSWTDLWTTSSAVSDSSWQSVDYPLPAEAANTSTLRLRWSIASNNSLNDIGWNIDDVEILGEIAPDVTPPLASLSVANLVAGGPTAHPCSVTYQDETAVSLASLDATDLRVTGPNGFSSAAGWVGADASADGSPIIGTYSIPPPGGSWDHIDNGTYTISLQADAVEDVLGNSTPGVTLGTFIVNVSPPPPGLLAVTPESGFEATGPQGGPFSPAAAVWTLSNTGQSPLDWSIGKEAGWIDLSAQTGTLQPGASTQITISLAPMAGTLAPGIYGETLVFANTTDGNGNTTRPVSLMVNSPGVLEVTPSGSFTATGTVGGPFTPESATYTLANTGGSPLDWTAAKSAPWLALSASSGTLAPGSTTNVTVSLNSAADQLEPGSYQDVLSLTNTTNGNGNTTRPVSLTVNSPGVLEVTPSGSFTATGTVGGPFTPESATYTLANTGGSPLDWIAAKSAPWLALSASSGTLAPGATANVTVSLNSAADQLEPGSYQDVLSLTNTTNGTGNTTRPVSLTVNSPGVLEVTPSGSFTATGTVGGPFTPESATYTLANTGGSPLDWTAAKSAPWLALSASSGTLAPGATANVTVSLNSAADQLEPGSYQDAVVVTSAESGAALAIWQVNVTVTNPLKVLNATTTMNGQFQLILLGPAGAGVVIEATTDFSSWTPILETQIGEDGTLNVTDPESGTLPMRFYRVRRSP